MKQRIASKLTETILAIASDRLSFAKLSISFRPTIKRLYGVRSMPYKGLLD